MRNDWMLSTNTDSSYWYNRKMPSVWANTPCGFLQIWTIQIVFSLDAWWYLRRLNKRCTFQRLVMSWLRLFYFKSIAFFNIFSYTLYAISVRTASVIPIESARVARSYKNDPHHWRQLCIEGMEKLCLNIIQQLKMCSFHCRAVRSYKYCQVRVWCGDIRTDQVRFCHMLEAVERNQRFKLGVWLRTTVHTGGIDTVSYVMIAANNETVIRAITVRKEICCSLRWLIRVNW